MSKVLASLPTGELADTAGLMGLDVPAVALHLVSERRARYPPARPGCMHLFHTGRPGGSGPGLPLRGDGVGGR
ncbi:hypothetical protein ACFRCG_02860 [Embleya sp. NPDC056575]|uniref:hypothetical protein n=1 Tax=unclassified Embleya TaxID=2699296 RepID=UPI0036743E44